MNDWTERLKWTLTVREAEYVESLTRGLDGAGCAISGDHRPSRAEAAS